MIKNSQPASLLKWVLFSAFFIGPLLATAQESQQVIIPGLYRMPENVVEKTKKEADSKSGVREDLHKFMGYERDPERYLSLPFDVFINNNLHYIITDVGLLILLILPILFLLPYKRVKDRKAYQQVLFSLASMVLFTFFLIVAIPSAYLNKNQLATPQQGIDLLEKSANTGTLENLSIGIKKFFMHLYEPFFHFFAKFGTNQNPLTYPLIFALFVCLLGAIAFRLKRHSKATKALVLFLAVYFFFWWILGSGAPWYGILLFSVPYILLAKGISLSSSNKPASSGMKNLSGAAVRSGLMLAACGGWLLMFFAFRSTNFTPNSEENGKHIYIPPIIQYQTGRIDEKALLNAHLPSYQEVKSIINQDDESMVYRVGTLLHYFIKKNDRRVFSDTFLDFFDGMIDQFKSKEKIIQALKASGFKYIVIDLNMAGNDFTPERSLTRKFIQLLNTLYNNPGIELMYTDRTIQLNSNGQVVSAVFEDKGKIVNLGTIALYRIK